MANTTDKSILTAAGKALLAQLNAEEKPLIIDKMIFANVPNRPEFPQPDDVVPTDHVVHQEGVEQRGRLSADSVIYSTTLTSDVGPFEFNWTGAYCSEYGVLVTIDHHALTPKSADEPGVAGNTLVRSVVLEYKDIAEITNITVDASSWQYNATPRMKKMDDDVAQAIIDQNGKDWFIEDGFLVTPQASAFNIKAGAGYVSGNRVTLEFERNVQVPNKPSFIYVDAHREGTPTGEQVTLFAFVVTAEEKDDYTDANGVKHFVCKIAQVLGDGSVNDLRLESNYISHIESVAGLNWEEGKTIKSSQQVVIYQNHQWNVPSASNSNPIRLGKSPLGDSKMKLIGEIADISLYGVNSESDDAATAIEKAAENGVKELRVQLLTIDLKNTSVDAKGMKISGINTSYKNGQIYNAKLDRMRRYAIRQYSEPVPSPTMPTTRLKTKLLMKTAATSHGFVSPNGESYTIVSPSSYGGVARFELLNGLGGSGETDAGAPFDRLRVVHSWLHDGGYALKVSESGKSAGVEDSSVNINDFYPNADRADYSSNGVIDTICKSVPPGEWIEYELPDSIFQANCAVVTSAASSEAVKIEVNGHNVKTFSAKGASNRIQTMPFVVDGFKTKCTVRITNDGAGALYLAGLNMFNIATLPESLTTKSFIDKVVLFGGVSMLAAGTGASMDNVLIGGDGIRYGSYHGGDKDETGNDVTIKVASTEGAISFGIKTSHEASISTLNDGDIVISPHIMVRNKLEIQTSPNLWLWMSLDFGIDGGCNTQFRITGSSSPVILHTIYSAMHSSSRNLSRIENKVFDENTPTNDRIEFVPGTVPIVQMDSSAEAQVAYCPTLVNLDTARSYALHAWDSGAYIKFYGTPLESMPMAFDDSPVTVGCLYQYGKFII